MNHCLKCNKETKNAKFCSRSCSASFNNNAVPKRGHTRPKCIICDNSVKSKRCRFCSHACYSVFRRNEAMAKFDSKTVLLPKGNFHSSTIVKEYIYLLKGNQCSICSLKPIWNDKKLVLILDHINGVPDDWDVNNLRLVCPNCDSQLPTYKSKNHGSGRPYRQNKST